MKYDQSEEFNKDLKKLLKKYRTLEDDISILKRYSIEPFFEKNIDTTSFVKIEGKCNETFDSYKVRKFACRALKNLGNRSGIRIIFTYNKKEKIVKFIEMYYKGDKENEDEERLKEEIKIEEQKNEKNW